MARICAVGVYVGQRDIHESTNKNRFLSHSIRFDCWHSLTSGNVDTALAMLNDNDQQQLDYASYNYDQENKLINQMTDPIEVFEFKLGK